MTDGSLGYEFSHVHIYASDPTATITWLTDGLGGRVVDERTTPSGAANTYVRIGGQLVLVRGPREGETFADARDRAYGLDHFGLSVSDMPATLEVLRARGIEPETPPGGFALSSDVHFLRGPDDVWVELTTFARFDAPPPDS